MTQPLNQRARCEAMGDLDEELGEFWMENPWEPTEHNLSAFERNRILLNDQNGAFIDVSHLTTADSDADSRSVAAADINGDGMQDLLVRSSGGGGLKVFLNQAPAKNWLKVSLRGTESNSLGIGARLLATIDQREQPIARSLYPVSCFRAQQPSMVYFGLGDADEVNELTITWPNGTMQSLKSIKANQHLRITEGNSEFEVLGSTTE